MLVWALRIRLTGWYDKVLFRADTTSLLSGGCWRISVKVCSLIGGSLGSRSQSNASGFKLGLDSRCCVNYQASLSLNTQKHDSVQRVSCGFSVGRLGLLVVV